MNNSLKGALLSGLVFPGVGQIYLGHYKRGVLFVLTASISLLVMLVKALQYAFALLEEIELKGGVISMSQISNAANQALTVSESLVFMLFFLLIVVCWILGIVDAYRTGRKKDREVALPRKVEIDN